MARHLAAATIRAAIQPGPAAIESPPVASRECHPALPEFAVFVATGVLVVPCGAPRLSSYFVQRFEIPLAAETDADAAKDFRQ